MGFADTHNHQFANLGFGGNGFWGQAYGPVDEALPHCDSIHGPLGLQDGITSILNDFVYAPSPILVGHKVGGNDEFNGWPRWNSVSHQAVHEDWLRRAVDGGLRLLVVHAVNNEFFCKLLHGSMAPKPGWSTDMSAVDRQLQAAHDMQADIDRRSGVGNGWYRIVGSPEEAHDVIRSGKLAVVLGIEVDFLFDAYPDNAPTTDYIRSKLDEYYDRFTVRHIFPIHFSNNAFGGAAFDKPLHWDPDLKALGEVNTFEATTARGLGGWCRTGHLQKVVVP